jgi:acyl carrier protein
MLQRNVNTTLEELIMLQKVQEMLAEALNVSVSEVGADAKIVEDLGADSLDVVELLSRLEDEFGITIPDDDVENLVTVGDVAAEIEKLTK